MRSKNTAVLRGWASKLRADALSLILEGLTRIPLWSRRYVIVAHDLAVAALSFLLAFWLRLSPIDVGGQTAWPRLGLLVFLLCFLAAGWGFRLHLGMWSYVSLPDLIAIVKTVAVSVGASYLILFFALRLEGVPRSLPLIQCMILILLLGGSRLVYRLLRDGQAGVVTALTKMGERLVPVLLVGTSAGTNLFIRALRNAPQQPFAIVGILETKEGQIGRHILDVSVLGPLAKLGSVVHRLEADGKRPTRLILTDPVPPEVLGALVSDASRLGITVCRTPEPLRFKDASEGARIELRPVALEDLLNRPQVNLDEGAIDQLIKGRRVLVTGSGGSIGSELGRQIAARDPAELILLDSSEFNLYSIDQEIATLHTNLPRRAVLADVRHRERIFAILEACRPELVFHAAALKHVPIVELNPCEGVLTNAIGTKNVADGVRACGALGMVLISTDKAVNPANVMGASKRLAEFYCQALDFEQQAENGPQPYTRFMTVRFGNVLGSSGSVIPLFQKQLKNGGPLTVTHPTVKRYFMTIPEAVGLILHATAHGVSRNQKRGQIFVLDMGEPIRITDIANRLIRLAGLRPGLDVGIKIVGLRPGEKLNEELFDNAEQRLPATVSGVHAAISRPISLADLQRAFDTLSELCLQNSEQSLRETIALLVPGYSKPDPHEARCPAASTIRAKIDTILG